MQKRCEPSHPYPCVLPHAHGPAHLTRLARHCVRDAFAVRVPLAGHLPSTTSATASAALFAGFAGTTCPSDFPSSCISGVPPQRSLSGPPHDQRDGRAWDLPVLAHKDSVHAQVLRPRGVRRRLAITPPTMWPSACGDGVGTPIDLISRLNSPACTYPYQRFADALTERPAHDSGPPWIATPSMSGVLIPFLMPVYPGAPPRRSSANAAQGGLTPAPERPTPEGQIFAVGTALAGGPPHRSQRAELPHWAPASGASVEAHGGVGVHDAGGREPSGGEAVHPRPVQTAALAAAP